MTLQQLKDFLAVLHHGSFRGAARSLGVSQAGLTNSVRALESSLGAPLMRRTAQGLELTDIGERVRARAVLIDAEARRTFNEVAQWRTTSERHLLRVGLSPTCAVLLPRVAQDFQARHPACELHLGEGLYDRLIPDVLQGVLDFACLAVHVPLDRTLVQRSMLQTSLAVVGRADHPLRGATRLAELVGQRWVLLGPRGGPGATVLRYFEHEGLPAPEATIRCDSFIQLAAVLSGTDDLALVPRLVLRSGFLSAALAEIPVLPAPPRYDLSLVHRAEVPLTAAATTLASMLVSYARTLRHLDAG